MRRPFGTNLDDDDDSKINLTPMLDVVFIMLIFFIVTATFVKEVGLDVNQPDEDKPKKKIGCTVKEKQRAYAKRIKK